MKEIIRAEETTSVFGVVFKVVAKVRPFVPFQVLVEYVVFKVFEQL